MQLCLIVLSAHRLLPLTTTSTTEELLEEVAEPIRITFAASEIAEASEVEPTEPLCREPAERITLTTLAVALLILAALLLILLGMCPVLTILIILLALDLIAQHCIGLVDFLKALLGFGIVLVHIGVVLLGQLAVGLSNVVLCGIAVNAQHLVIVYECHIEHAFFVYMKTDNRLKSCCMANNLFTLHANLLKP